MASTPVITGFDRSLQACLETKGSCTIPHRLLPTHQQTSSTLNNPGFWGGYCKMTGPIRQQLDGDDYTEQIFFSCVWQATRFKRHWGSLLPRGSSWITCLDGLQHSWRKFCVQKPGSLNHPRWLTSATRILILYTRTLNPSETLKLAVI